MSMSRTALYNAGLQVVRAIRKHWTPLGGGDWRQVLNMLMPCPDRVVTACQRKFHRRYR